MRDVLEVSYTGDLLAHRRCARAWAYEKYAGFHPYEQAQAMEGRLVHHGMEWLTERFREAGTHATASDLEAQLIHYFKVLWARGIKTAFASKTETVTRVRNNLFPLPSGAMHPTVRAAIEGATHTEYEIRTVRKLIRADFAGKSKLLLTGILDLVVQLELPLTYSTTWTWSDDQALAGTPATATTNASAGDVEVWDYKGSRADSPFLSAFVLQLLTYAGLYAEHVGHLPKRCVIFFVNEPSRSKQLLAIPITAEIVAKAEAWTIAQAKRLRATMLTFEGNPLAVSGGDLELQHLPVAGRIDAELAKQCTACGVRFDCPAYQAKLADPAHSDLSVTNTRKN